MKRDKKGRFIAGIQKPYYCATCEKKYFRLTGAEGRKYCSRKCMVENKEWKSKVTKNLLRTSEDYTAEIRQKLSDSHKGRKSYLWKGGRPKCDDCGKQLVKYGAIRCQTCSGKEIMSRDGMLNKVLGKRGMSGLEKKVLKVIKDNELPYKFVGDGKLKIENKCPDFININGEKVAVEVYWRKHKNKFRNGGEVGWKKERIDLFNKYGWNIIFLEGTNLTNSKIISTLKGGEILES